MYQEFSQGLYQRDKNAHKRLTKYRRRRPEDGGFSFKWQKNGKDILMEKHWLVPYCLVLCKPFNAHINVEFCNSVKSIKYVYMNINKKSDK